MTIPDPAAGLERYERLEAELTAMINSGIADPESWFNAGFGVGEAIRWAGLGYEAEHALEWSAGFRADRDAPAAWARVGMPDEPIAVIEALTVGLDPLRWQRWRLGGFSHESTVDWCDHRFTLADAIAWIESGAPEPSQAAEWAARGFSPAGAKCWRVAIREVAEIATSVMVSVGFSPEEAGLAHLAGITRPPELADRVPGDMTRAIEAGRADRDRHAWMANYRPR